MCVIRRLLVSALLVSGFEMVGRTFLWFGTVALGPAVSVASIVNRDVVYLEFVRLGLAH